VIAVHVADHHEVDARRVDVALLQRQEHRRTAVDEERRASVSTRYVACGCPPLQKASDEPRIVTSSFTSSLDVGIEVPAL
jgi:hypothetical protein